MSATPWPETVDHKHRAAICSYGYGGYVTRLVLESAPQTVNGVSEIQAPDHSIILLPAPQQNRLVADAASLSEWMSEDGKSISLSSITNALASRREHHGFRLASLLPRMNTPFSQ